MTAYLSRIRLATGVSARSLIPLIMPADDDRRAGAIHHWLWALFSDGPERRRDFLWREEGAGRGGVLALSARPPVDPHGLFKVETKAFTPALATGDRLRFSLRASPSLSLPGPRGKRGRRVDPVARALAALPAEERPKQRVAVQQEVATRWLAAQGARAGFTLDQLDPVTADDWRSVPRPPGKPISYPVLDLDGILTVTEPERFLASVLAGFGREKAFGCGLMLIRRA